MARDKVVTVDEAVQVVLSGDTVATGGFVGIGFPEYLAVALERRFLATGQPADLTLIFAAGQGDGKSRGLNHFGHRGMVRQIIGGHWGLVPALGALVNADEVDGCCLPQGVISTWFRDVAAGRPGSLTRVGLGTFIDPRLEGGRLNRRDTEHIVKLVELRGEEFLFLPSRPIDVALLCGTTADQEGNVTMEREAVTLEVLSIAQAVKNSGGLVIVQVERTTTGRIMSPREVKIPGILVDAVVVSPPEHHWQTFAEAYNPAYTGEVTISPRSIAPMPLNARKVIARRAALFLKTQRSGQPRHRYTRRRGIGRKRGGRPRSDHTHRRGRRSRRHPGRRPELRSHGKRPGDHRPAVPVRLLRRRRPRPGVPRHGRGRRGRQRQRQPVRHPQRRARWFHQHQPVGDGGVLPRPVPRRSPAGGRGRPTAGARGRPHR